MPFKMAVAWNEEKNSKLKLERGLCFEDVQTALESGGLLGAIPNPATGRAHQKILVVEIDGYVCGVTFVIDGGTMFLKTIYRSRALNLEYARRT